MGNAAWRSETVGSLLRPHDLVASRTALMLGKGDPVELRNTEDLAILAAIHRQEEIGLDLLTDGEFRRFSFLGAVTDSVDGFTLGRKSNPDWFTPEGKVNPGQTAMLASGKLAAARRMAAREAGFLREHARKPYKITLPSPLVVAQSAWKAGVSDKHYPRMADLMWAAADLVRAEVDALAADGAPCIQIDNPGLAYYIDPALRDRARAAGIEVDIPLEDAVAADNRVLAGLPADKPVASLHVCRGNWSSSWLASGGYEPVAEQVFSMPRVNRFLLEFDTPRSGGFKPLGLMPKDKQVVLGLVSSKHGRLETKEALVKRIDEAASFVPLERLALSPQCGFATSVPGNLLSEDEQWAKLELVATVARFVWE